MRTYQYRGITIFPAGMNVSGIRWTARTGNGQSLRADTLENMRDLIRRNILN